MMLLTKLRKERGWSKLELSRRTRIAPADITRIEQGRFIPYPSQLARLAEVLGVPQQAADELLRPVGPEEREPVGSEK